MAEGVSLCSIWSHSSLAWAVPTTSVCRCWATSRRKVGHGPVRAERAVVSLDYVSWNQLDGCPRGILV
jgi:hypothetical protein